MLTEKEIISAALNLPLESRAVVIDHILGSLMKSERGETDALWAEETEERIRAYERGEIKSVPGEQVFQDVLGKDGLPSYDFRNSPTIEELAEAQGVRPIQDITALFGTWPGEEDDGFEEEIRRLRQQDIQEVSDYENPQARR
ncbi:MAG: hypothetical protein DRI57_26860 [Deltaproteobacteria bacterium]|nr:MAG: hypothetical protein DRI57_26860 [Deltaproteobacteria bacterium]